MRAGEFVKLLLDHPIALRTINKCRQYTASIDFKYIFCASDTEFVSATNVARAGKQGNIFVGNNVSATMRPRLPGPLVFAVHCNSAIKTYEKAISELPYVSTSKRVLVENL